MKIIYLTIGSIDLSKSGIYLDLIHELKRHQHDITIVTADHKEEVENKNLCEEFGVKILRVPVSNQFKVNHIKKAIAIIKMQFKLIESIKINLFNEEYDLVLYHTPPVTFAKVVEYCKKKYNCKSYLMLKDIFPQNAVDIGIMKEGSLLHKYFRKKEKELYRHSDYIGCMSQANVDFLLRHNPEISSSIVEVCQNSINPLIIEKKEREIIEIKNKYSIPLDKTIFIYGGNLGKPQGIDFLIECLKYNKNNNAHFVIVGSGTEFNKLKTYYNIDKPKNTQLFEKLPSTDYQVLVNSCDVGLIFLDHRFTIPNFPSRLLSYMQASIPVIAATDANTDIGEIIENGNFGYWCESVNVKDFNNKVQQLCDPILRKQMGINARHYLENHYTSKHTYDVIMKHFK